MEENEEVEKLDMSKKPETEVAVFGLGVLMNKMDKQIKMTDRTNFLLSMIEKKLEKLIEKR